MEILSKPLTFILSPVAKKVLVFRGGFKGDAGGSRHFYFLQALVFCNHFQELRTMLFEVQLIINNATLIYVYPNSIETCLTPKYLLFGRHLLSSSNTTSTLAANLTVLSSTTNKINRISNHFWARWRHKNVNLRETQRISKLNIKKGKGTQILLKNCH